MQWISDAFVWCKLLAGLLFSLPASAESQVEARGWLELQYEQAEFRQRMDTDGNSTAALNRKRTLDMLDRQQDASYAGLIQQSRYQRQAAHQRQILNPTIPLHQYAPNAQRMDQQRMIDQHRLQVERLQQQLLIQPH